MPDRNWDEFKANMEDHIRAADEFVIKVRQTIEDMNKPRKEEAPAEFILTWRIDQKQQKWLKKERQNKIECI